MPELNGLWDMDYFWWSFLKIVAFGIPLVVIFVAIDAGGFLLQTLVSVFRSMRK